MSTVKATDRVPVSYRFGAGTAGVWMGLGIGRAAVLASGLLVAIAAFTVGVPAGLALVPLAVCLALAAARAAGRPLLEWISPGFAHHRAAAIGSTRWSASFPSRQSSTTVPRLRFPAEYGCPRIRVCDDDPSLGILTDSSTRTVTVVFDIAGIDRFPLLDIADRDALLAGWGRSLAVLADTDDKLARLQLIERACHPAPEPESTSDIVDFAAEDDREMAVLYRYVESLATTHDSRLAVQWSFPRVDIASLATVKTRCRSVSRCLFSARLLIRPLNPNELADELTALLHARPVAGAVAALRGPVSRRASWSHVSTDDTVHRSFAVTAWPAAPVMADWLEPLLLSAPAGVTRTVALHLERVNPVAAARVARTVRAKAALDQRDRVRLGMSTSAVSDAAEATGIAMDEELAAGFRTHRLTALVTVSADSLDAIDEASRQMRQAAAAARLELQPLHGQHDRALAATLPLCRVRPKGQS